MKRAGLLPVQAAFALLLVAGCNRTPSEADREDLARLRGHVKVLASDIGPRPAGSPGDRSAQDYVLGEMSRLGLQVRNDTLDQVLLVPGKEVRVATSNVVGTLSGQRDGAILVGSHHDSRNATCPGASDDASGVAVMLEAARVLARSSHRSTLIFASFGGEETLGLPGSRMFVKQWNGAPVRLAITMDFVGSGRLFIAPFPTPPELWANQMLRRAEIKARTGRVSFDPWLVIVPRLIPVQFGADHESFLEAGIPALNLSCQFPDWTYHTAEDIPSRVEGRTLLAARDLVVRMVEDADEWDASPSGSDRGYFPLTLFGFPLFLRSPALAAVACIVCLLALATLVRFKNEMATLSGIGEGFRGVLVSIPLTILVVSGPFIAEAVLRKASGLRHPAYAHLDSHLAGALLAALFTFWLSLSLARFLRPSTLPGAYLVPAVLLEGALAGICLALGRSDVAFPFLAGTGAMLLASWSHHAIRRLALGILGAAAILPFLSPTTYRMFLELSGVTLPRFSMEVAAGVLFLPWFLFLQHLSCLPEALYARPGGLFFRPVTGLALAVLGVGGVWANALRPSYDSEHQALVRVREEIDLSRHRAVASLSSLESLRSVRLGGLGEKTLPDEAEAQVQVSLPSLDLPGLSVEVESVGIGESRVRIQGKPPGRPRWVGFKLQSGKKLEVEREGKWEAMERYHLVVFPHGEEVDQIIHLRRDDSAPLVLEGDMSYDSDLLDLRPSAPFRTFRMESRVRFRKRLL